MENKNESKHSPKLLFLRSILRLYWFVDSQIIKLLNLFLHHKICVVMIVILSPASIIMGSLICVRACARTCVSV